MNTSNRTILGIICAAILVGLLIWSMPTYKIEPKGIVLPYENVKAPFNGSVAIYDQFTAPFSVQKIGFISVMYHTPSQTAADQQIVINAAKEMARQAGGEGIIVSLIGHTLSGTPAPMAALVLRGEIIVPGNKS